MYHAAPIAYTASPCTSGTRSWSCRASTRWQSLQLIERDARHVDARRADDDEALARPRRVASPGNMDLSSLRWIIHGAAPCPVDVKRRLIEWLGPIVYEYYASTEAGGTVILPDDWLEHPGSVGRPWGEAAIRILSDDGAGHAHRRGGDDLHAQPAPVPLPQRPGEDRRPRSTTAATSSPSATSATSTTTATCGCSIAAPTSSSRAASTSTRPRSRRRCSRTRRSPTPAPSGSPTTTSARSCAPSSSRATRTPTPRRSSQRCTRTARTTSARPSARARSSSAPVPRSATGKVLRRRAARRPMRVAVGDLHRGAGGVPRAACGASWPTARPRPRCAG